MNSFDIAASVQGAVACINCPPAPICGIGASLSAIPS
jgi:hypothetical protein